MSAKISKKNIISLANKVTFALFLCTSTQSASAADPPEYEIRVGATRSDNVLRTDVFEIKETIALVGLTLDARHETRKVMASLVTDVEYRNYTDNAFDDDVVGALNADLLWQFVPGTFSWVFQDQFGQLQSDPFRANSPVNRENINRFSTGPDLRLRMGSTTALEVGGRFHVTQFELSDADNDVLSASVSIVRALSPRRSLSLNVKEDSVKFDTAGFERDYDRQAAFLGFKSEVSRGSITVNLGRNKIDRNGQTTDGSLIHIAWNRDLSPSTTLNLAYDGRLTDSADTLGRTQNPGQGFGDPQRTAGVSDPFENKRFTMGLNVRRNSNNFYASMTYNDDEYITQSALNRDRAGLNVGLSRVLGSAWRVRLSGMLEKTEFAASGREDDDTVIRAGLSRQLSRLAAVNLDVTRFDRDSNESDFDYVENTISLTFSFRR